MSIKSVYGYRCPKCNTAWSSYSKDYNGIIYCKNTKCNNKLINKKVKISIYSFFEYYTNKDLMIKHLETYLKELRGYDEIYDFNFSEEYLKEEVE